LQANTTEINSSPRFDALTGVRWFAATLVFVYHNRKYWRSNVTHTALQFMNEMGIGVAVFFVLSGFLIAYTYGQKPLENRQSYFKYFLQRAARILPLYWLILTARYIDYGFPNLKFTLLTYSLFHGYSGVHNLDGIGQAWTLSIEMAFYILAPLLFLLGNKSLTKLIVFCLGLFSLAWFIGWIWTKANGNPGEYFYGFHFLAGATFLGRFPEFLAGMWLAMSLKKTKLPILLKWKYKTLVGFLGLWMGIYLLAMCEPNIFSHGTETWKGQIVFYTFIPFFTMLWLAGLITEKTKMQYFLSSKPMVLLGNASFAFYLVHLSYVNIRLRGIILFPDRNYVLLWIISILLYLTFEKPLYSWVRKLLFHKRI